MSSIIPPCQSWFFTASLSLFLVCVAQTASCVPISILLFFFDNRTSKLSWTHGHERLLFPSFPCSGCAFMTTFWFTKGSRRIVGHLSWAHLKRKPYVICFATVCAAKWTLHLGPLRLRPCMTGQQDRRTLGC